MTDTPPIETPTSGGDFDMMSALDWKDGIATLPESNIRFRMNEFGALEIVTDLEMQAVQGAALATEPQNPSLANSPTPPPEAATETMTSAEPEGAELLSQALEEAPSVVVVSCGYCGISGSQDSFIQGKFCSPACAQPSSCRASPVEQRDRGGASGNPGNESDRLGKRVRRKRKLYMDSGDEDEENPEEEEEKSKAGKGRRAAKQARQVMTQPAKKKVWSWHTYLEEEKAVAAPVKLFKEHQSFPQSRNGFKVGMKLEGLDPCHPSLFCVLTVAEVQGYRIRLHFDGYPECYDFWVNADAWDIKPAGWCEKTGHKLLLPKGCKDGEFNWSTYVKNCRGQIAPKHLFKSLNTSVTPSGFRPGMKLEAVDRKNPSLICVATIAGVVDNRLLIHFDNWDDSYDYWCDSSSPYIHPVGYCQEQGLTLTAPAEYKHPRSFSWEKYLEETGSQAAPARAFKQRPSHGFQVNMKLEAVDKRNPMLIRVATIMDTEDHRVKIHFDCWSKDYDYWVDADSSDIHPVGWCQKTGHPLQNPLGLSDSTALPGQGCPTPGCNGVGHIRGPRYGTHYTSVSCPYSEINLNKEGLLPDRLSGERTVALAGPHKGKRTETPTPTSTTPDLPELQDDSPHSSVGRKSWSGDSERSGRSSVQSLSEPMHSSEERIGGAAEHCDSGNKAKKSEQIPKCLKLHFVKQEIGDGKESPVSLQQALHDSVFTPSCSTSPTQRIQMCWEKHCKLLPEVLGLSAKKVAKWTTEEVTSFVRGLPGCKDHAAVFRSEQIDGEAFLLLTQADIVKILSIKLGPALKIYNSILMFKSADEE
nr:PREDICTED: lethal(3)malignant brain tumor-like protein 4 isoform X2 [Lepisosteus oculatus]XP_015204016.1 PREDICTED: lethal(3)malignant brain tumor-like protein 4 isoform X2 [Lepisosteus oculatus]XP_015204017.1 PREDICTED: lethal(3)malignant brain tumor-like protein 4 isoform X2 [Lepisosteus oculatus]XP_015204018.1 PREDICTED: lethal(3)malignant brain tumor-like protein 4 isoform X2 [Lepisosteus oculatus]XP_015204019.1 PREDICTED: lethal(3)malignant brain tumor-like protein 4 isoform X2 [Lepisos